MREFIKSTLSYTWSMSIFSAQQMVNILMPSSWGQQQQQHHPATRAFNNVADCTEEEMGDIMKSAYRAGDNIQRGMVDLMFGVLTLGAFNPGGGSRMSSNVGQQSAEAFRQGVRAAGQAVGAAGQAAGGSTYGQRDRDSRPQPEATGWGPVPPAPCGRC